MSWTKQQHVVNISKVCLTSMFFGDATTVISAEVTDWQTCYFTIKGFSFGLDARHKHEANPTFTFCQLSECMVKRRWPRWLSVQSVTAERLLWRQWRVQWKCGSNLLLWIKSTCRQPPSACAPFCGYFSRRQHWAFLQTEHQLLTRNATLAQVSACFLWRLIQLVFHLANAMLHFLNLLFATLQGHLFRLVKSLL